MLPMHEMLTMKDSVKTTKQVKISLAINTSAYSKTFPLIVNLENNTEVAKTIKVSIQKLASAGKD